MRLRNAAINHLESRRLYCEVGSVVDGICSMTFAHWQNNDLSPSYTHHPIALPASLGRINAGNILRQAKHLIECISGKSCDIDATLYDEAQHYLYYEFINHIDGQVNALSAFPHPPVPGRQLPAVRSLSIHGRSTDLQNQLFATCLIALRHTSPETRLIGGYILACMPPQANLDHPLIRHAAADDECPYVRASCIRALSRMRNLSGAAYFTIAGGLDDCCGFVRCHTASVLCRLDADPYSTSRLLIDALNDDETKIEHISVALIAAFSYTKLSRACHSTPVANIGQNLFGSLSPLEQAVLVPGVRRADPAFGHLVARFINEPTTGHAQLSAAVRLRELKQRTFVRELIEERLYNIEYEDLCNIWEMARLICCGFDRNSVTTVAALLDSELEKDHFIGLASLNRVIDKKGCPEAAFSTFLLPRLERLTCWDRDHEKVANLIISKLTRSKAFAGQRPDAW